MVAISDYYKTKLNRMNQFAKEAGLGTIIQALQLRTFTASSHDYLGAHADWTLSSSEKQSKLLVVTNANGGANIIAPAENRDYIVSNGSGQAITIKKAAGTGITIADGKVAEVFYNGTDYARLTADV